MTRFTVTFLSLLLLQAACVNHQKEAMEEVEAFEEREAKHEKESANAQTQDAELHDKIEDLSESLSELAQSLTQVVATKAKESSKYVGDNKDELKQQLHQLSLKMDELAQQTADSSHDGLKTLLSRMEDAVNDLNESLQKKSGN